jgi:DNA-binding response OmpR family regulator
MKKILIVEDDQIVSNIYRNKFSVEGYEVETAGDGEAGLEIIRSFRPDAVILDLMLPKLNGVELMKQLRAEPAFTNLPIFVFSNTYLSNLVQEAWKAGATKCLCKSACSPKQLLEVISNALRSNGSAADGTANAAAPAPAAAPRAAGSTPPAASPPAREAAQADAQLQADIRSSFLANLPPSLAAIRALNKTLIRADNESAQVQQVELMLRRVHSLAANSSLSGLTLIAQMADAFEAFLKELGDKPKSINPSTLRTVAAVIDFLALLCEHSATPPRYPPPPPRILVVDDEPLSRRAVTHSLDKARLKSVSLEDPQKAYNALFEQHFDLIFLDVDMPGMNGFELCSKLRKLPKYEKTPVIFVTNLNDFESRANSMMSGGNDFIAKPFLFMELAVKALIYVLRRQLNLGK